MPAIPRDGRLDSTMTLARDPYRWIGRTARWLKTDVFWTRVLLEPVICMTGPEAARLFYDPERIVRGGATPRRVRRTLFGESAVQTLDGDAHRERKAMLMTWMGPDEVARLGEAFSAVWDETVESWGDGAQVTLYRQSKRILTRAACDWAGVPLRAADVQRCTDRLADLFEGAGALGGKHWVARLARTCLEAWLVEMVERTRREEPGGFAEGRAAHGIAVWRDARGAMLEPRVAAVEILNLIRPTVAVAVYITFLAHAMHVHGHVRVRAAGDPAYRDALVQEVRRWYPFVPAVMGRTREAFEWNGMWFPAGWRVMLDLYGTNRDRRSFTNPDAFFPDRFVDHVADAFALVPQGGGRAHEHHRCAGEAATMALMRIAVDGLLRLRCSVPEQDVELDYGRLPALPRSGMRVLVRGGARG